MKTNLSELERLLEALDAIDEEKLNSEPWTCEQHCKQAAKTIRSLQEREGELEGALRNVRHWRVPHDDQLTVTDGSRRALREAWSLLTPHTPQGDDE